MTLDRAPEYRRRDLHAEGEWPPANDRRYGGVIFNGEGRVLLREPTNHFDGYVWTFPKGTPRVGEHSTETALREVLEETGLQPRIVGHVRGLFDGSHSGSANYFYLMFAPHNSKVLSAMHQTIETSAIRFVSMADAKELISQSRNPGGRARDLLILEAGGRTFTEWRVQK